jgi:glycosyltransferase involved in cell wall biosynthesis
LEQKPLHILFLCSWYPNPDSITNGVFIRRHAQALALKHYVTVLFVKSIDVESEQYIETNEGNLKEILFFYPKSKVKIPLIGSVLKFLKFKSNYKRQIDLLKTNFDFIHLNTIFPAAIPALYAINKFPKAKFFITEHWSGYYPEDGNYKGFLIKKYTQKIVEKAKAIFVISDKLKNAMQNHNLVGNFELINNVVDTSIFKPFKSENRNSQVLQILHVSSLVDKEKNITGIIKIADLLKQKNVPFNLTIIGDNPEEINKHKELAYKNLTKSEIIFVGYKTSIEISNYMNQSDVFLLFSNYEGMPVVLIEAMACGLPVITTNVGQINQMVMPSMGIILNSNDINECVEKLCKFKRSDFLNSERMHDEIEKLYSYESVCQTLTKFYTNN